MTMVLLAEEDGAVFATCDYDDEAYDIINAFDGEVKIVGEETSENGDHIIWVVEQN